MATARIPDKQSHAERAYVGLFAVPVKGLMKKRGQYDKRENR
jgi:hypothetical protein